MLSSLIISDLDEIKILIEEFDRDFICMKIRKKFKTLKVEYYETESLDVLVKLVNLDKVSDVKKFLGKSMNRMQLISEIKQKFPNLKNFSAKKRSILEKILASESIEAAITIISNNNSSRLPPPRCNGSGSSGTKGKISSTMKRLVWNAHIGEEIGKTKCLCCKVTDITQLSFNCGHVIAEARGGETIVSNLRPICQNCNSSMGTKNMHEFMRTLV
jgi:hypothetical protein